MKGGARLRQASLALALVALGAAVAGAAAPDRSLRPEPRPGAVAPASSPRVEVPVYYSATVRPRPRTAWSPDRVMEVLPEDTVPVPVAPVTPAAGGVVVRFTAEVRPRARPWLDRTRPSGPAPSVLGAIAPVTEPPPPAQPEVRVLASTAPVYRSPRPPERPDNLQRRNTVLASGMATAVPRAPAGATGPEGTICGNPAIRGRVLPPIAGRISECAVANPVQVTEVAGIRLSTAATMTCETAQALLSWTERGAVPAVGRLGGGIAEYRVAAHYACRPRNNQRGERISEHGKGKAIDISAFTLRNGVQITVLDGWPDRTQGRILQQMHRAACGPFGTVLGPEANRLHRDHFHFDTASYRSGPYCR